jgi:hypothetical protein
MSRRQRTPELRAEVERIVALKKQIPKYGDIARAYGVSVQVVRHMISEAMPAQRTKIQFTHR